MKYVPDANPEPDYDGKVYSHDWDDEIEADIKDGKLEPITQKAIEEVRVTKKLEELRGKKVSAPSVPTKEDKPSSSADRKRAWKKENREHYLAKNREYVARSRAKKDSK